MLRISKVLNSRDAWKQKASQRAEELREARKTKKRHLYTIASLKQKNKALQEALDKKNNTASQAHPNR